jgi:DNA-binding response OmpR family regulator
LHNLLKNIAMTKKILIVDDNDLIVEVMSYILVNCGYDVSSLSSGEEVISKVNTTHPDLIILDAMLPGMDGRDICKILKLNKSTHNLRVIMCSAYDEISKSLNQTGAPDDFLSKPFDMTTLLNKVEHQLAA